MDFETVVNERFSARAFDGRPVSDADLRHIVELAQRTPSWVNSQPWKVYVACGDHLARIKTMFHEQDAQQAPDNPDLSTMHREEWGGDTQANMKRWRHNIVHHFATFDEAHESMAHAMQELNDAPETINSYRSDRVATDYMLRIER